MRYEARNRFNTKRQSWHVWGSSSLLNTEQNEKMRIFSSTQRGAIAMSRMWIKQGGFRENQKREHNSILTWVLAYIELFIMFSSITEIRPLILTVVSSEFLRW